MQGAKVFHGGFDSGHTVGYLRHIAYHWQNLLRIAHREDPQPLRSTREGYHPPPRLHKLVR